MKNVGSWIALLGAVAAVIVLALLLAPAAKERAPVFAPDSALIDAERPFGFMGATDASADSASAPAGTLTTSQPSPHAASEPARLVPPEASTLEPTIEVRVQVTVSALSSGGIPGADRRVEVGLLEHREELGEVLLELVTDSEGTARGSLPWSALDALRGAQVYVWARSEGPGVARGFGFAPAPRESGRTVDVRLDLIRGAVIEGWLLAPDGQPAAGTVSAQTFGEERILVSPVATVRADGRFRVEAHHEGKTWISGEAKTADGPHTIFGPDGRFTLGTGFSEPFDLDFLEPPPWVEVRTSGPGVLRGRVLDERGEPAVGVRLFLAYAGLPRLHDAENRVRHSYPPQREGRSLESYASDVEAWLEREGRGQLLASVVTDAEGAFFARGLRRDLWTITARIDGTGGQSREVPLTPHPIPSDGKPLELRLSRPHLLIRVRHANGSPPNESFRLHLPQARPNPGLREWPARPGLLVTLAPEHSHRAASPYLMPRILEPDLFLLETEAGLSFDVGTLGGSLPWTSRRVHVPEGAGRVDVDVLLPEEARFGTLVLSAQEAVGPANARPLRVRVIDPASGVPVLDIQPEPRVGGRWPRRLRLPEGEYLLSVEDAPRFGRSQGFHGSLETPRTLGAWEASLSIVSGRETKMTARLGRPAYLHVRLAGVATDADRDAVRAGIDDTARDEQIEAEAASVELRLERPGRWSEPVLFTRSALQSPSAAGSRFAPSLTFGAEETSQALSPGEYQLTARMRGGRILRQPVTLRPGTTLEVALVFE